MITYLLECLVFQLVFLLAYDLWLRKETFFQWNRAYLLVCFALSLVLPWIKLEVLRTDMPEELGNVSFFLTQLDGVAVGPGTLEPGFWATLPWYGWVLGLGGILTALWFAVKLVRIGHLKQGGKVEQFPGYAKIIVGGNLAFSFFRNIFLGEEIQKDKKRELQIVAHELVHVRQRHSLDLIFFELARIPLWFNPLVYLYQARMAELHEFIADAQVVKAERKEHFQLLLSQTFQTQNISFVNQFFKGSLIKMRISMMQKNRSKAIWHVKYVLLLPLLLGMLVYTSCENERATTIETSQGDAPQGVIERVTEGGFTTYILRVGDLNALSPEEEKLRSDLLDRIPDQEGIGSIKIVDADQRSITLSVEKGEIKHIDMDKTPTEVRQQNSTLDQDGNLDIFIPFAVIEQVPVFPGCEDSQDKKLCFTQRMQEHIMKNFHYPEEAQELGIQGRVSVLFLIGVDGSIVDIRTRGPHELLEGEARRIIEKLPKMQPGMHKGEAVRVPFSIPITFKLQDRSTGEAGKAPKASGNMTVSGETYREGNTSHYRGKVTDGASLALPGATISIEGSPSGVVSDFDGRFSIAVSPGDVLKFEYTGLPTKRTVVPQEP